MGQIFVAIMAGVCSKEAGQLPCYGNGAIGEF